MGRGSIVTDVAGRLALVIGSECAALNPLNFAAELAGDLQAALGAGGWQPVGGVPAPVLDPGIGELRATLTQAFRIAHEQQATLLVAFIGHGATTGAQDFHLLAHDSPAAPDAESAFHLGQGIRDRLNKWAGLDGLIVLVDACQTGEGVQGAARQWTDVLAVGGRMELLVAAGDDNAFGGCFTRTLLATFAHGLAQAGENLLCTNLLPALRRACKRQDPQHLSFAAGAGGAEGAEGDAGLFLVPNNARQADAVTGLPAAGLVDQLTRGVVVTQALTQTLAEVADADHERLRLVVGPAGCGKSTLVSLLIRPALFDVLDPDTRYVDAAVFLDLTSSVASVAEDLATQLDRGIPGFAAARAAIAAETGAVSDDAERDQRDSFDVEVAAPLARCRKPGRRVRLLIDGLDQPETGARDTILAAIARITLTDRDGLDHVRIIVTARSETGVDNRPELAHGLRMQLEPPSAGDLERALGALVNWETAAQLVGGVRGEDGGWLIGRLLTELDRTETTPETFEGLVDARLNQAIRAGVSPETTRAVVGVLVAAGPGPILPLPLLGKALGGVGQPVSTSQLRDVLVQLGALASRGTPGRPNEQVGIAHAALVDALAADPGLSELVAAAHWALAAACSAPRSAADTIAETTEYITRAGPRHHLLSGNPTAAIAALEALDGPRAADNRDRWESWLPAFTNELGPDHPDTLTTRNTLARWRGEAGDPAGAATATEQLLTDRLRVLGPDHPDTLSTRHNLASWRGHAGDPAGAATATEQLLTDCLRVLGPDHPNTLTTRNNLARWRAVAGHPASATSESRSVP